MIEIGTRLDIVQTAPQLCHAPHDVVDEFIRARIRLLESRRPRTTDVSFQNDRKNGAAAPDKRRESALDAVRQGSESAIHIGGRSEMDDLQWAAESGRKIEVRRNGASRDVIFDLLPLPVSRFGRFDYARIQHRFRIVVSRADLGEYTIVYRVVLRRESRSAQRKAALIA